MLARRLSLEGGGHVAVCQQGRWVRKGGGLRDTTLIGVGNKFQRGRGGWIVRSHINWGGEQTILYKGVETSP